MRRLLAILAGFAIMATACSRDLSFVQMSDPQIGFLDPSPVCGVTDSLMRLAVLQANALKPDMVFITGDLVNDAGSAMQDSIYRLRRAGLDAPVWEVQGNHDPRGHIRFAVRKRGCVFIGIDSNCIKDDDAVAEASQLEWLKDELRRARGARHIFVFLHCPIIRESIDEPEDYFNFPAARREAYINLLRDAGVDAVFSGHCHRCYSCTYEGISFFTAGPVGTPLGPGTSGFNFIKVDKNGFSVDYLELRQPQAVSN
ncbi:MAG: metallophosphoesterase [Bacteroidales bacterium]|nr:metallophosphoesterase [Bacteroidales bacterium]